MHIKYNYYFKKQYAGVRNNGKIPLNSMLKEDPSGLVSNIQRNQIKERMSECAVRKQRQKVWLLFSQLEKKQRDKAVALSD